MRNAFDAADPFDATADAMRTGMCDAALTVIQSPSYLRLSPEKQVEAVICGMVTGVLSVAFSCIEPEGRDDITAFIKSYIDQARVQVESIQFSGGTA